MKWFKVADETFTYEGKTLKRIIYNEDIGDNIKKGDKGPLIEFPELISGQFLADENCIISGNCHISDSYLKNCRVSGAMTISKSSLENADICSSESGNCERRLISNSTIKGTENAPTSIRVVDDGSEILLENTNITTSASSRADNGKIHIYVKGENLLSIKKSEITLANGHIKNFCQTLLIEESKITDAIIVLSMQTDDKTSIINKSEISGQIDGGKMIISESVINGKISLNRTGGYINIAKSGISKKSKITLEDNTKGLTLRLVSMFDVSEIYIKSRARKVSIYATEMSGNSSMTFEKGNKDISHSKIFGNAVVKDCDLASCEIGGTAYVRYTDLIESKIDGDVQIGFAGRWAVPEDLFLSTSFQGLKIEDKKDFYIIPVLEDDFYYIFTGDNVYKLSKFANPMFRRISIEKELEKIRKEALEYGDYETKLLGMIVSEEIFEVAKDKITKFVLKKSVGEKYLSLIENAITVSIIKLFATKAYKSKSTHQTFMEYDKAIETIGQNVSLDIKNKELEIVSSNIFICPEFFEDFFRDEDFTEEFMTTCLVPDGQSPVFF